MTSSGTAQRRSISVRHTDVKYSAFPCGVQAHYSKPGEEPDYLLRRLQNQLDPAHNGRMCLNLQAQVMTDPDTQPVENTLVPWDPEVARWQKLATIEIPPQTFSSYEQQDFCDRLAFNPWHGLKVHRPVGGINRSLRDVAANMQDVRFKASGLERVKAAELDKFLNNCLSARLELGDALHGPENPGRGDQDRSRDDDPRPVP